MGLRKLRKPDNLKPNPHITNDGGTTVVTEDGGAWSIRHGNRRGSDMRARGAL